MRLAWRLLTLLLLVVPGAVLGQEETRVVPTGTIATSPPAAAVTARRGTAEERFLAAVAATEDGRAEEAVGMFAELVEEGLDHGLLHYNLGNAQLRAGRLGAAIASYRRAAERLPRDGDVAANLDFARKTARDAIAPPTAPAWARTLGFWHFWLAANELRWVLVLLNALAWSLAGVWLLRRRGEILRWLIATCFLGVLVVGVSVAADLFFAPRVAVVVPAAVDVLAGPAVDAVLRFELHAGAEVRLVEERGGWLRVELPDGQQGWLPVEAADVVRGWRG